MAAAMLLALYAPARLVSKHSRFSVLSVFSVFSVASEIGEHCRTNGSSTGSGTGESSVSEPVEATKEATWSGMAIRTKGCSASDGRTIAFQ